MRQGLKHGAGLDFPCVGTQRCQQDPWHHTESTLPPSYLTAETLSLGSQGPSEVGSPSERRWRHLGEQTESEVSWPSHRQQGWQRSTAFLLLYTSLPQVFPCSPPPPCCRSPQAKASSNHTAGCALGLHCSAAPCPQVRGPCTLTVRQEVHPLPQAFEVGMPQGHLC